MTIVETKKNLLLFLFIIFIDQLTKYIARFFHLPIYYNFGVSFGLLQTQNFGVILYGFIYLIILCLVGYLMLRKPEPRLLQLSFVLLLAGGVGNSLDRLFNSGGVIDFIRLGTLPVFNVSDLSISVGVLVFIYYEFKQK